MDRISLNPAQTNPCDATAMQRTLAILNGNIAALQNAINSLVDITNILNVNNINDTTLIQTIVENNTFVNNVNEYVSNYISNYYTSVYAQSILFHLNADLAVSGGVWQAAATVDAVYSGEAPVGAVTVKDPAGIWRWKALSGAKGVAVRGAVDGSVYIIMAIETVPAEIRGTVFAGFTTADDSFEAGSVAVKFDGALNPTGLIGGGRIRIGNPPAGASYMFAGSNGDTFMATLVEKATKPANVAGDVFYECWQLEC